MDVQAPKKRKGFGGTMDPRESGRKGGSKPKTMAASVLHDMRRVYKQPENRDKGEGQKRCRELLKSNPARFMDQLTKLEAAHREDQAKKLVANKNKELPAEELNDVDTLDLVNRMIAGFAARPQDLVGAQPASPGGK